MKAVVYKGLPIEAKEIRQDVFISEQGFENEYDEIDETATHIVVYKDDVAMSTCRIFESETKDVWILGRLAVKKEMRGTGVGSFTLSQAEKHAQAIGVKSIILHSQTQTKEFYAKNGYQEYGEIEYEQDCPHIWMKKEL